MIAELWWPCWFTSNAKILWLYLLDVNEKIVIVGWNVYVLTIVCMINLESSYVIWCHWEILHGQSLDKVKFLHVQYPGYETVTFAFL